jgi:hypothetical protein
MGITRARRQRSSSPFQAVLILFLAASWLWGSAALAQTHGFTTELVSMVPASAAIPSDGVTLTLLGRGFRTGQSLVSHDPAVAVLAFQVASPGVASAVVRVLPTASPGPVRLDIYDPDGRGTLWQTVIPELTLVPSGALSAPLSVQEAAIVFPAPGTLLATDNPLMARGVLSTSGSGVIIGRFLLDGIPYDQFVAMAGGGAPVGVAARIPIPLTSPGGHSLQVEVLSPQRILSGAVTVVVAGESRTALALLDPGDGTSTSGPPLFRWTFVPGAAGYEVTLTARDSSGARHRWRSDQSEFTPAPAEWAAVGAGSYLWTVRAVFPGDVAGAPAPSHTLFVAAGAVELSLSAPSPGPRPGTLWLSWEGGPQGALYRLEFSRAGRPLFDALTRQPKYLLRLPDGAGPLDIAVTAIGPDGRPLGPPARGTSAAPRSERLSEPVVQFATGPVTVTAVAPAENATVTNARPAISARWQGVVEPEDMVLFLDTTDVTAMAALQPGSFTYSPLSPLSQGNHSVHLSLGPTERSWSFTVSGAPPEVPAGGGTSSPAPAAGSSKEPTPVSAPTGSWTLQAAAVFNGVSGSGPGEEDTARATLTGQSDLGGESGFFKSTVDASWRHDFQDPHTTVNESRSWLLAGGGGKGEKSSFDLQAGYGAAEILGGSQFLSTGLTRGAGQLRVRTPIGEFGAFASFDDNIPGVGGATGAPQVNVQAASYLLPLPSKDYSVRLLGLWSQSDATAYAPSSSGRVLGALATLRFSPAFCVYVEVARSSQTPQGGDATWGNAFRLGFSGTAAGLTYALNLRRVDGTYSNAANPGFNAGGIPDRQGGDLALSRAFGKLSTTFSLQYAEDGVAGGGSVPSTQHWQVHLGFAHPMGKNATVALDVNGTQDRGGEDLSKGLPGVRRDQAGLVLAFAQHSGKLFFAESYTGQRVRDSANPASEVDMGSLVFSMGGTIVTNLSLAATASLSRTDMPYGVGRTDMAVLSLAPAWTIPDAHLTLLPLYSYTRMKSDDGTADSRGDEYGLTVQWTPAFWHSFLAVQASALWTDMSGLSTTPLTGSNHRYLLSVSFRWGAGRGGLNDRFSSKGTPTAMGMLSPVARPFSSAALGSPYYGRSSFVTPGL